MATPKIIPYEVQLRSTKIKRNITRPVVYTNDLRSAEFQFIITDMDASELLTATAKTMLYMRDGSFFQNPSTDVSRVGNVFSYLLKENEGNHAGIAKIQLVVYFNEGLANEQNFPTQLYEFEIINGLETKVAQEVMIYDWTTLTRDARAYIDEFVANEILREAEFDNNEFDRNAAFNQAQTNRTTAYGIAEAARDADYEENEALRQAGYDVDHSRADTDHTRAENDSILAGTDHTRADSDSSRAGTDHTRAEADHTRADADSATVAGFNTRLAAEETATANNKISSVKGKTFADVDARLEDVETDTTMMGTNGVTNGDFSNGTTGWIGAASNISASNNELTTTATSVNLYNSIKYAFPSDLTIGNVYYTSFSINPFRSHAPKINILNNTVTANVIALPGIHTKCSVLFSPSVAGTKDLYFYTNGYATTDMVIGSITKFKNISVIDLTAAFGKGNEPTAEQMDGILAKFPNSWFDGTKNLFRANAALNKLMAVDARTEFEAKNALVNGDASNGTTGWTAGGGALSVVDGSLQNIGNGSGGNQTIIQTINPLAVINNKYYYRAKVRVTNGVPTSIRFSVGGVLQINGTVVQNVWENKSGIITATTISNQFYVYANYVDGATQSGKILQADDIALIDLTAAFGAGKEPTLAEMDRLMARFPNSWFDGVKPIQTIETLYQEKANKVQEAWITPTLVNGWVNGSQVIKYRKDTVGNVHIEGTVKNGSGTFTSIFTLPVGYRPIDNRYFPGLSSYAAAAFIVDSSGAVSLAVGTATNENRICATFSTD